MKDVKWLINRLKAMKPEEIIWRLQVRRLQKKERKTVYTLDKPVTNIPLPMELSKLHIDINRLSINWDNKEWSRFETLNLFGIFDYSRYKNKWNAGFQTENSWPEEPFSQTINISQRVDIGDIRTNWELNRHYQFAALAKSYYCTKEKQYLTELKNLFDDWNVHNLFLHGVEWTSAMELAIRVNSWVYMFCFLKKAGCDDKLLEKIEHGILVMTNYIIKHRSRFSSANNHLIVEMYAVALVGIVTDYIPWKDRALKILTEELPKQNYTDGINKEMSLHYQGFVMEAYGLLWIIMIKNNIKIPMIWKSYLTNMTEFVADSSDDFGNTIEFGDDDEGKILDLNGWNDNYFQYILNFMGCILDKKYTDSEWHENLYWIVPEKLKAEKKKYIPELVCCRKGGGYTFLRSKDRRILIGIDHAALGFGSIAAHGHADALSFQMYVESQPVFVDPGTYLYHCGIEIRNAFRKTENHNTVIIDGKDQSEMLGAFLWGKRAECKLIYADTEKGILEVEHNGYFPILVRRRFELLNDGLRIIDYVNDSFSCSFILPCEVGVKVKENEIYFEVREKLIKIISDCKYELKSTEVSSFYGEKHKATKIVYHSEKAAEYTIRIM